MRVSYLTFPNNGNDEATLFHPSYDLSVTTPVVAKLREPENTVTGRSSGALATRVVMPKAAMDEDGPLPASVCYVRRAGQVSIARSEPEAGRGKELLHRLFGAGRLMTEPRQPAVV